METIESQAMAGEQLEQAIAEARRKVQAAEARVKNARDAVGKCQSELSSKENLRAGVVGEYDRMAAENDLSGASECRAELELLETQLRGAQLRLQAAQSEAQKLMGEFQEAQRAEGELSRLRQLGAEAGQTTALISQAEETYLTWQESGAEFLRLLQELKMRTFMDPANKRKAQACFERLNSLARGFAWFEPPTRKSTGTQPVPAAGPASSAVESKT